MNKYFKPLQSENGFSVVEMMTAIVIAGLIMGAVGSFLAMHIKSFETTLDVIDTQYEAQLSLNALGEVAMESRRLSYVYQGGTPYTDTNSDVTDPEVIGFINMDDTHTIYYYDKPNERILFKDMPAGTTVPYTIGTIPTPYDMKDQNEWYDFAFNIESWRITSGVGSSSNTYASTDNIYIYMIVSDGDAKVELSNLFKFRNKHN